MPCLPLLRLQLHVVPCRATRNRDYALAISFKLLPTGWYPAPVAQVVVVFVNRFRIPDDTSPLETSKAPTVQLSLHGLTAAQILVLPQLEMEKAFFR